MNEDEQFEAEVVRVARLLFGNPHEFEGPTVVDGRERDGIFKNDQMVVAVEATTSRSLEKARKDGIKLNLLCDRLARENRYKAVKAFFVTRDEPTAQQRDLIKRLNGPVEALSLDQLRTMLVDSREYLHLRGRYPYGSAKNPKTADATTLEPYIDLGLKVQDAQPAKSYVAEDVAHQLSSGCAFLLLGDFGAGKSMTLREIHSKLAGWHLKDQNHSFPITLNLQDHRGQSEPDEAIHRHAKRIGFKNPDQLVRAWRAGQAVILLDGFDEIATTGWLGRVSDLKQVRRRSVELVRNFVDQSPLSTGVLLSGRRHFFDDHQELMSLLVLIHARPLR